MTSLDKKIAIVVLVMALLAGGVVLYRRLTAPVGEQAIIEVDNKPVKSVVLDPAAERQTIVIAGVRGDSIIEVDGATIRMVDSACPDKVCVHMGVKSRPGDVITCIPNRVVIKIPGLGAR